MKRLIFILFFFLTNLAFAQIPVMLNDFESGGADAFFYDPSVEGISVNNQFFFLVDDGVHGEELWRTNGTEVGTQLLKDIYPNEQSSSVNILAVVGNTIYFSARDPEHGTELWKTEGVASGTKMVADLIPGPGGGNPTAGVVLNDVFYFPANGDRGRELYRTEGTEATTQRVRDINSQISPSGGYYSSSPSNLTLFGDQILFTANDGDHGVELWKTNGTFGGTTLVKDIRPGQFSTNFGRFKSTTKGVYFVANDGVSGSELWISDGTEAGTFMLKDITEGSESSSITLMEEVNGIFYFVVSETTIKKKLWKTDGTTEGTEVVLEGNVREFTLFNGELFFKNNNRLWKTDGEQEEQVNNLFISGEFAEMGGLLYFIASESGSGTGIWKTDGTAAGVSLVKEVATVSYHYAENLTATGSHVYFTAETEEFGNELWVSDGTAQGTFLLWDVIPGPDDGFRTYDHVRFGVLGNNLLFAGWDEEHGRELWKTDGTVEGTKLVKDINSKSQDVRLSGDPVPFGDQIYFLTTAGLWKTDGSPENTELISEFALASGLHALNDKLIFTASTETVRTIWTSDGTAEGTLPLFNEGEMPGSFTFQNDLPAIDGFLFFSGRTDEHGYELWKTDGSAEGTAMVMDIYPGEEHSFYSFSNDDYLVVDNILYFVANDGLIGDELWRTDGTAEGTFPITDINPFGGSGISYLRYTDGTLFFIANDGASGYELWKSDGTTAGTVLVKDINPGAEDGVRFSPLTVFKGEIYFAGSDNEHGKELWKSDGTAEGTVMIKDIYPAFDQFTRSSNPSDLYVFGDRLYFIADNGNGKKIWHTDGTTAGTVLFSDYEAFYNTVLYNAGGTLLFSANDGQHGLELFRLAADGTPVLLFDLFPGPTNSAPTILGYYNDLLFFTAIDKDHGRELWTVAPLDLNVTVEADQNVLCDPEETQTFSVAGPGEFIPDYQWYVNGEAVNGENGQEFTVDGLTEGDEVSVRAIAGKKAWVKKDSITAQPLVISYEIPVAVISVSGSTLTASDGASFKWFLDGEPLPDVTQSISVKQSGGYQVEVTNASGCSALSALLSYTITGLNDNLIGKNISAYPNPAASHLFIDSGLNEKITVSLYDTQGRKLRESILEPLAERRLIPVDDLLSGVYIIQFHTGKESWQFKLAKY